jgi:predicted TIM-barrel fold metal-dependent hydrolase
MAAGPLRIIDAHTHLFTDAAMAGLWLGPDARRTGQLDELTSLLDETGVVKAVILLFHRSAELYDAEVAAGASAAAARQTVRAAIHDYNVWGCRAAERDRRLLPFVGVNPRFMSAGQIDEEIGSAIAMGAVGVKIIPNRFKAYADDPLLCPVYESCCAHGVPLLSQAGSYGLVPGSSADPFGRPKYFRPVLERFCDLRLILAHMGHSYEADVAELVANFPNVYTDVSLRLSGMDRPGGPTSAETVAAIRSIGTDRVLFGTNYPFANPVRYVKTFEQLPLTDTERSSIAAENFERLMQR